jgi:hypothetical protein
VRVAGGERVGHFNQPDHLEDPELEAALQRALKKARKKH